MFLRPIMTIQGADVRTMTIVILLIMQPNCQYRYYIRNTSTDLAY